MKVIGTHDKRLDRGRNIFTVNDDMVLLTDADTFLYSLFPDIFRRTPASVDGPHVRGDAISCPKIISEDSRCT